MLLISYIFCLVVHVCFWIFSMTCSLHSFQLNWLTACMFCLDLDSRLLLFQIKSVETKHLCCPVHWSGASGDIWPTGPSYIHMSKANTLELLQSCTEPSMWKISIGYCIFWLPAWWALWLLWWPLTDAAMFQCVYGDLKVFSFSWYCSIVVFCWK